MIEFKTFKTKEDAIKFVSTKSKWLPCDTEWESPCKACLKWCCSFQEEHDLYNYIQILLEESGEYTLFYDKWDW